MRVLVCGSRLYADARKITAELERFVGVPGVVIVHGDCRGADRLAAQIAVRLGFTVEPHPADWDRWGRSAGFRRNQEMLDSGIDGVLAFKASVESRGTDDMIGRCKAAGVPGVVFTAPVRVPTKG